MPHTAAQGRDADGALECLALLCQLHNRPVSADQLESHFPSEGQPRQSVDLLRAAGRLGFKAKSIKADWGRLRRVPLPAIVRQRDGRYLLLARIGDDDRVLVHDPREARPMLLPREVFEPAWSGEIVVCRTRGGKGDQRRFGLSWFIPVLFKYRRLFGEILVASLFVQLFALITPLFFQVVIDKVLVHKGLSTLDVLAMGLLAVSLFEVVLAGVRDYLLSHTTNRIDVELGAIEDETRGLVYKARLTLASNRKNVEGKWVNLTSGMGVVAEIKTGQRRIIEYVLRRVLRHGSESMRDR